MNYQATFTLRNVQTAFGDNVAVNDLTFIIDVGQARLNKILGDALKVAMRTNTNRETCWENTGKSLTVMVNDSGLTIVNPSELARIENELRRKGLIDEMINPNTTPERIEEIRQELRSS